MDIASAEAAEGRGEETDASAIEGVFIYEGHEGNAQTKRRSRRGP